MKLNSTIKTAALASLMALGLQGMAYAGEPVTVVGSTVSGNRANAGGGPHVRVFNGSDSAWQGGQTARTGHTGANVLLGDGSVRFNRDNVARRATPNRSRGANSIAAPSITPPPAGLLLPAVQTAREAAR